jgi:tRNA (guanine37-N1)-methyltransferase
MRFDILTLFPGMFTGPFDESIIRRGVDKQLIDIAIHNIRDWATDRHQTTDDAPYGGGAGMVMKVEPLTACIESVKKRHPASTVVMTSREGLIIVCGRYEGIDERVRTLCIEDEISIGDFVLTGGEIAAMTIVDAVTRLIPGVLGSEESAESDSFCDGLLEYPQYTRPPEFRGLAVPDVLLSGNHELIRKWRRRESLRTTRLLRPDLMGAYDVTREDRKLLAELDRDETAG